MISVLPKWSRDDVISSSGQVYPARDVTIVRLASREVEVKVGYMPVNLGKWEENLGHMKGKQTHLMKTLSRWH